MNQKIQPLKLGIRARRLLRKRRKARNELEGYKFFNVERPGYLTVTKPRIGLHEAEDFRKELTRYLEIYKKHITLDTSQLDNLDCAGIAVIVKAEAAARKIGSYITLEGLHGRARHTTEIMQTLDLFEHPENYIPKVYQPR